MSVRVDISEIAELAKSSLLVQESSNDALDEMSAELAELASLVEKMGKKKYIFVAEKNGRLTVGKKWNSSACRNYGEITGILQKVKSGFFLEAEGLDTDHLFSCEVPKGMEMDEYREVRFTRDPEDVKAESEWRTKVEMEREKQMEEGKRKDRDSFIGIFMVFVIGFGIAYFFEDSPYASSKKETKQVVQSVQSPKVATPALKSQKGKAVAMKKMERMNTQKMRQVKKDRAEESANRNVKLPRTETIEVAGWLAGGKDFTVAFPADGKYMWKGECITDAKFGRHGKKERFSCAKGETSEWMPAQKEMFTMYPSLGTAKTVMKITVKYL